MNRNADRNNDAHIHDAENEGSDEMADAMQGTIERVVNLTNHKYNRRIAVVPGLPVHARHSEVFCLTPDEINERAATHPQLITDFVVEQVDAGFYGRYVALRAKETQLYLTAVPYGEQPKSDVTRLLRRGLNVLQPEIVDRIVEYVVMKPASEFFEGPGFSYKPITAEPGPLNTLQMFRLTGRDHGGYGISTTCNEVGIRTFHGTYLRSGPGVTNLVSQSALCADGEKWEQSG